MNTEAEALLAILRGDDEAAERLVRSLTERQRQDLSRALYRLNVLNDRIRTDLAP